jgi:hypothetical protein
VYRCPTDRPHFVFLFLSGAEAVWANLNTCGRAAEKQKETPFVSDSYFPQPIERDGGSDVAFVAVGPT